MAKYKNDGVVRTLPKLGAHKGPHYLKVAEILVQQNYDLDFDSIGKEELG